MFPNAIMNMDDDRLSYHDVDASIPPSYLATCITQVSLLKSDCMITAHVVFAQLVGIFLWIQVMNRPG
ncbi:hypothetical protein BDZ94DRAFT_1248113 [Collybia nuda]|uniref:Uncharacterized protein n=1 Tax=Collybia nuda TaxID=64659 RepID=A0A9P5YDC2_9AGAR|nr:hypothetical protein BDZ94DRAFT_1248113 [Collybia nuda]